MQLRWDGDWGAEATDLDLHLFDATGNPLAQSLNPQEGSAGNRPYEIAFPGAHGNAYIQITSRTGDLPRWIQIVLWGGSIVGSTGDGSITSPAESANSGMLAVGATHWDNTDTIEEYSSRGPTPDGRIKPDLVGVACGETALLSTFCGTSQAAPHIAGLAALGAPEIPGVQPSGRAAVPDDPRRGPRRHRPRQHLGHGLCGAASPAVANPHAHPHTHGDPHRHPDARPHGHTNPDTDAHPGIQSYRRRPLPPARSSPKIAPFATLIENWTPEERTEFFLNIDYTETSFRAGNYSHWVR